MRALVIGSGRMGMRHIEALQGLGIEVSGIYDINHANSEQAVSHFGLANCCAVTDITEFLAESKPDMCVVATTAPSHKSYVLLALNAGVRKILCEKPLATSLEDCEELLAAQNETNAHIAVNHQMRYMEQYILPKTLLNTCEFGGLQSITVNAGNFGLSMNGLHYIEMLRFMTDHYSSKVMGWFDEAELTSHRGPEYRDRSGILKIVTEGGVNFYLNASATQGHGVMVNYVGKYGQIIVDELGGFMYSTHRLSSELGHPTARYGQPSKTDTYKIEPVNLIASTQAVLKDLLAGTGYPSLYDASMAIRALIAGYASNDQGNIEIELKTSLPTKRVFAWA